jgi:hypothetical protein
LQPWANFTSRDGSGEQMHLVERFTRIDDNTIDYVVTVNDPLMYTRPWTVRLPLVKTNDFLYEYACHEGNYSMPVILRGGQAVDAER